MDKRASDGYGSNRWIREQSNERWIMQAMDQGVIEGAMVIQAMDVRVIVGVIDGASDGSWSKR